MKHVRLAGIVILVAAVATSGLMLDSADAQKKKKQRSASMHQLMEGLVGPNCGALSKALKADKANWKKIALHAALLNESGHILMADGRCPDDEWAKGAKTVQDCSAALLKKAAAKDIEGARKAFSALTKGGCGTCHKAHKK
jgi:hypothetical protein